MKLQDQRRPARLLLANQRIISPMRIIRFACVGLVLMLAAPVTATDAAAAEGTVTPPEASISLVGHGTIRNWMSDGGRYIYIEDTRRHWYRATLDAPCPNLRFAIQVAFTGRGIDRLDRFSWMVLDDDERCNFTSLIAIDGPPVPAQSAHAEHHRSQTHQ